MKRKLLAGLAVILSGMAPSRADLPSMSVDFDKSVYRPGDVGSYTINLDASNSGMEVTGALVTEGGLPSVINQPLDGYDIFSSGSDTSGTYLDGFLEGEAVSGSNRVEQSWASVAARTLVGDLPWPVEPVDKVITRYFTIDPTAQPGDYSHSITGANLFVYIGPFPPPFVTHVVENFTSGTFAVDTQEGFVSCMGGPSESSGPGCSQSDYNLDGHVDIGDFAIAQTTYESSSQSRNPLNNRE